MPRCEAVFPTQSLPVGDTGQRRPHAVLSCCKCDAVLTVGIGKYGGGLADEVVRKKVVQAGWRPGRTATTHLCPEHAAAPAAPRPTLTLVHPQEPSPVNTRTLSFADRRLINAKLEEVFQDELVGYRSGWSDAKVAADLGVPVEWVADLRTNNFGPADGNTALKDLLARQVELRAEFAQLRARMSELAGQLEAVDTSLNEFGLAA